MCKCAAFFLQIWCLHSCTRGCRWTIFAHRPLWLLMSARLCCFVISVIFSKHSTVFKMSACHSGFPKDGIIGKLQMLSWLMEFNLSVLYLIIRFLVALHCSKEISTCLEQNVKLHVNFAICVLWDRSDQKLSAIMSCLTSTGTALFVSLSSHLMPIHTLDYSDCRHGVLCLSVCLTESGR